MSKGDTRTVMFDLLALHADVDQAAGRVAAQHGARLVCKRGCSACCVDDLTVFEVEAERIREHHPEVLTQAAHPPGACAMLDGEGACRVYHHRPYVCRTQGLPLIWYEETPEGEVEDHRAICELNIEGPPLAELEDDALWLLGPFELRLQQLQQRLATDPTRAQARVALRSLFRPAPNP
jgi:uncharacterized protein